MSLISLLIPFLTTGSDNQKFFRRSSRRAYFILLDINECVTNNPCKNGASCENSIGSYTCRCTIGFNGKHCDQGKIKQLGR